MIPKKTRTNFLSVVDFDPTPFVRSKKEADLPVDYFDFYNSVSSVYSSKIEGEEIDFDSFYKYKFLNIPYNQEYTQRSDDLFEAYQYAFQNDLNWENVCSAHQLLSRHLLSESQRGKIRHNPMYVIDESDRIEYVACPSERLQVELDKLFGHIDLLLSSDITSALAFFEAAAIHLIFVKIHPFQDGNGRTARLLEKWFLKSIFGDDAISIELEKNYFVNRTAYYHNLRVLGLEYNDLDYSQSLNFLLMTINSLREQS